MKNQTDIHAYWEEYFHGPVRKAFEFRHKEFFEYAHPGHFAWNLPRWVIYFTPYHQDDRSITFQVNPLLGDGPREEGDAVYSKQFDFDPTEMSTNPEVDAEKLRVKVEQFMLSDSFTKLIHPEDKPNYKDVNLGAVLRDWNYQSADHLFVEEEVIQVCQWLAQNDKLYHIDDDPFEIQAIANCKLTDVRTFTDNEAMLLNMFWSWVRDQCNYSWEKCWEYYGDHYNIPDPQGPKV